MMHRETKSTVVLGIVQGGALLHEFEHTLQNILADRGMSMSDLAREAGYDLPFFKGVVSGKNRQVPVDFFIRVADTLDLSNQKKDELVRSWAFGVERWY